MKSPKKEKSSERKISAKDYPSLNIESDADIAMDFAKKAYETKLEEKVRNHFITEAKEIIKRTFPKEMISKHETPYIFPEDSCLVQICQVPGNACDIGLDIMDMDLIKTGDIDVNYTPHNVDMLIQQYALLSIFLNWAHEVDGLISR